MRLFRWRWGKSLEEQAQAMDRLSQMTHKRVSGVPHDRVHVAPMENGFRLTWTGGTKELEKVKDVEKFLSKHYRQVRDRLTEACHY